MAQQNKYNILLMFAADNNQPEALNKKALAIITRVRDKLTGRDFSHEETLSVRQQVDLLIQQATNNENLCQCYIGWYVMIYNHKISGTSVIYFCYLQHVHFFHIIYI